MCNFISWINYKDQNYYLTNQDLQTKEGKVLLKPKVKADIAGHGAILAYYPELEGKGKHEECEDFSTPKNFPKEIVTDIKVGRFINIGVCTEILNATGLEKYENIQQSAWEVYLKIQQPAWEAYKKIQQPAYETYLKIQQSAWEALLKTSNKAFWLIATQKQYRKKEWK